MREHATPAGFRAAVEARLRERARRLGVPAYIVRRQAALERLIVRLSQVAPDRWAIKGGLALETRLGARARVSLDLDADHLHGADAARADLQRAAIEDIGDHFGFAISGAEELREAGISLAVRYKVEASLAGRRFEPLQVDVTIVPPDPWDAQPARRPGLLAELGFDPIDLLLVPFVHLLLIRQHERVDAASLREAIRRVFGRRETHAIPERLPAPPSDLAVSYRREAERVGLARALDEAHQLLADWLNPVLAGIHRPGNIVSGA